MDEEIDMGLKIIYLNGGKRHLRCRWLLSFALLGRALAGTLDIGNGNVEVEKHTKLRDMRDA